MKSRMILIIIILAIYIFLKKGSKFFLYYEKIKKHKIVKNIIKIMLFISTIFLLFGSYINIKECISTHNVSNQNREYFRKYENRVFRQETFYRQMMKKNDKHEKYKEPYIPEDYYFVEGSWDTGFVIEDINKNQYVWVPCTDTENLEVELLHKNIAEPKLKLEETLAYDIKVDECIDENYESFINSALENGGFYISRFEIGKENDIPVSKKNVEVWGNVSQLEAKEIIKKMKINESINLDLVNGYAYDTTVEWLEKSNEIIPEITLIKDKTMYSGRIQYNNIYDIFDNIMELTCEEYYETIIIRGYMYKENEVWINRFNIRNDENYFVENKSLVAFRTILYK